MKPSSVLKSLNWISMHLLVLFLICPVNHSLTEVGWSFKRNQITIHWLYELGEVWYLLWIFISFLYETGQLYSFTHILRIKWDNLKESSARFVPCVFSVSSLRAYIQQHLFLWQRAGIQEIFDPLIPRLPYRFNHQ